MKESDKIDPHTAALHGDYKYIKESLEKLITITESQKEKIKKLTTFVSYYANCPCCNQDKECTDDCTFREDDPNAYEIMQYAREILK